MCACTRLSGNGEGAEIDRKEQGMKGRRTRDETDG